MKLWGTKEVTHPSLVGSMCLVRLPDGKGEDTEESLQELKDRLWREFRIEVVITLWAKKGWARLSAHIYNEEKDYEYFGEVILKLRKGEQANM